MTLKLSKCYTIPSIVAETSPLLSRTWFYRMHVDNSNKDKEQPMKVFKRVIGIVLIVIAAIVAIHTVVESIYHTSTEENPSCPGWNHINPLSFLSIIVGVIFGYMRMSRADADSSVQEFIAANTQFYGFLFAAIIFLWNWLSISSLAQDFTAVGDDTRTLVWIFFNATLPLLSGAMGVHLLRSGANEQTQSFRRLPQRRCSRQGAVELRRDGSRSPASGNCVARWAIPYHL